MFFTFTRREAMQILSLSTSGVKGNHEVYFPHAEPSQRQAAFSVISICCEWTLSG